LAFLGYLATLRGSYQGDDQEEPIEGEPPFGHDEDPKRKCSEKETGQPEVAAAERDQVEKGKGRARTSQGTNLSLVSLLGSQRSVLGLKSWLTRGR